MILSLPTGCADNSSLLGTLAPVCPPNPSSSHLQPSIPMQRKISQVSPSQPPSESFVSRITSRVQSINDALPSELILLVFDLIYAERTDPPSFPYTKSEVVERQNRHALLDVMLVCKGWRELVETSPRYWAMINVLPLPNTFPITPGHDVAEHRRMMLEAQLRRSGSVPIQVNIDMDSVMKFSEIADLLEAEGRRWRIINLLASNRRTNDPTRLSRLAQLFTRPFPCLKSLHMGNVCLADDKGHSVAMVVQVDAPALHAVSCHSHLVLPLSNDCLRYLSVTRINLDKMQLHLDRSRLEFGQLVELRISRCNPGALLAAFSTPNLVKLIVDSKYSDYTPPESLNQYPNLKELQWDDMGPDPTFSMLLPRCPNLTRFADYIVGREDDVSLDEIDDPPSVLAAVTEALSEVGNERTLWPHLEEIL
ncbi:hypothetical protein FRB90_009875, partial [Tulasnella sp. 427]